MRYATSALIVLAFGSVAVAGSGDHLRSEVLRKAALSAGLVPPEDTHIFVPPSQIAAGRLVFQSRKLSLENEIACASCHLDRFGSADGIPNAIGTDGRGEGTSRLMNGGDIIPRNAMPFWGRGGKGFDTFFWDGRVDASVTPMKSQFAGEEPSEDPFVVAVHLPPVEIGEMILDVNSNQSLQRESVASAQAVYGLLAARLRDDPVIGPALASASGKIRSEIEFVDVAEAIAGFIRHNFRVKPTRFHDFVFSDASLMPDELAGGLLFYGKGRCSACHNGPYFSDMRFHAIAFPQAGFGRNGFGVDYGRFNVTQDVDDLYKFRTPPLYNVSKTAPYSHSGSVYRLEDAIRSHVDPLAVADAGSMSAAERAGFYGALKHWVDEAAFGVHLDEVEISQLSTFLRTLEYDSDQPVIETE